MITLQKIADEAGVSRMTVSNVINGKTGKVSKQTLELIQEIIQKYNYVPNLSARSLAKHNSQIIAIFVNTFVLDYNVFMDPYISKMFGEIETGVRAAGYYTIVQTINNTQDALTLLRNWNADGAIFLTSQNEEDIDQITLQSPCPVVFMDSYSHTNKSFLSVNIDDYKGGYIATKYLLTNGHRKIGFAGCYRKENDVILIRYQGYLDALKEFGMSEKDACLIDTYTRYSDGMEIGRDIANHKYDLTAVFATSDHLALGIVKGCILNGYMVPNNLSVIGFDDLDLCTISTPELTTVSQNVHDKAVSCVRLLLDAIEKKEIKEPLIVRDVEVKVRQTVQHI